MKKLKRKRMVSFATSWGAVSFLTDIPKSKGWVRILEDKGYRKVTAKELMQWAKPNTDEISVDEIMEFLHDQGCLNERGEKLKIDFWKRYIKVK